MASDIKCNKFDKKQLIQYFKLRLFCLLGGKWSLQKSKETNGEMLYYFYCTQNNHSKLKKCQSKCFITVNTYTKRATIFYNDETHFH